jgi:hypothetical protein
MPKDTRETNTVTFVGIFDIAWCIDNVPLSAFSKEKQSTKNPWEMLVDKRGKHKQPISHVLWIFEIYGTPETPLPCFVAQV